MRGLASLATSGSMAGCMALDPSIPLSSAPKFNTPFEVLGQLGQIRAMRQEQDLRQQQIRTGQANEEDRRYKLAENKQNDEDTLALVQLMAANPTATQEQMKALVAQRVPRMLQKYLDVADKHEKEAATVAKDVTESMTKAQNYLANDAQDTLSAPEAARPAVFRQKLEVHEKLFPFLAPHFAQQRQRLDNGEDVTALLQGTMRSDPAARNADTTATTAAAELPGRQATSAMAQRVLAGSTPTGITAEQAATNALREREVKTGEMNARTSASRLGQEDAVVNLTPEALRMTAHQFAMTGQLPPMGMGKAGAATRTKIINEAAGIYKDLDLPTQVAAFGANKESLKKLQGQRDAVGAFEDTALKNLDQFLATAKRVVDTGSPLINRPLRTLSGQLMGSPEMAAYNTARQTVVPEFAKLLSNPGLSGQLTDSARKEVEGVISGDATLKQVFATANILKNDAANRRSSLDEAISAIQKRIATTPGQTATDRGGDAVEEWERDPVTGKLRKKGAK